MPPKYVVVVSETFVESQSLTFIPSLDPSRCRCRRLRTHCSVPVAGLAAMAMVRSKFGHLDPYLDDMPYREAADCVSESTGVADRRKMDICRVGGDV